MEENNYIKKKLKGSEIYIYIYMKNNLFIYLFLKRTIVISLKQDFGFKDMIVFCICLKFDDYQLYKYYINSFFCKNLIKIQPPLLFMAH